MNKLMRNLWSYRGFIIGSVKREFQLKYRNSMLGAAWVVLQPLAMIIVYTVVFSQVMRAKLPGIDSSFGYSIFLCAGVLTWNLFTDIVTKSQNMFLDSANLLKKISFPRVCIPVVVVLNSVLNFLIVFGIFTLFLILIGEFPGLIFISIIPLIAVLVLLAVGLGMVVGVFNVFFRDVGQFFNIFITFWFWLTPIIYPKTILPEWVNKYLFLNPVSAPISEIQKVLISNELPNFVSILYPFVFASMLCLWGFYLYRRHSSEMVDEL